MPSELLSSGFVVAFELLQDPALLRSLVFNIRVKEATNLFVVVFYALQNEKRGYDHKNLSVALLELVCELLMLLANGLNYLGEMKQLIQLF